MIVSPRSVFVSPKMQRMLLPKTKERNVSLLLLHAMTVHTLIKPDLVSAPVTRTTKLLPQSTKRVRKPSRRVLEADATLGEKRKDRAKTSSTSITDRTVATEQQQTQLLHSM